MSFLGSMLSDDKGAGFQGQGAGVQIGATPEQTQQAASQVNSGLGQQQNFINALQAQNGVQNQSDVYNMLKGQAAGTGPNAAQAMLSNATGANVANQAALMAGQRGAGANSGMMARQAAQQGGNIQQNAAGQGALMQAQQSQNAINSMGALAGQQVGQLQGGLNAYNSAAQSNQGQLLNAVGNQNNSRVGMQSNLNNNNAMIANTNTQGQQGMVSGVMNAAGKAAMMAEGGVVGRKHTHAMEFLTGGAVKAYAEGGMTEFNPGQGVQLQGMPDIGSAKPIASPQAKELEKSFSSIGGGAPKSAGPGNQAGGPGNPADAISGGTGGMGDISGAMPMMIAAKGGAVPAMVSPGERYLNPKAVQQVAKGKDAMKAGEKIPGKPKVGGAKNDYANDTVPKKLEQGGIVIPRSVTQGKDPHAAAAKFVAAVLSKQGVKAKK